MSDEKEPETTEKESTELEPTEQSTSSRLREEEQRILLVPYPKIIFLYPTFIIAIISGIILSFVAMPEDGTIPVIGRALAVIFLVAMATNLLVIGFDFPRATSLSLFLFGTAVVLGGVLTSVYMPEVLGGLSRFLGQLNPFANATFYWCYSGVLGCIYVAVVFSVRFDYWEVRHNELLHHHGFLSDLKRYAAPNLRVDKEINDVFEYLLLRSGRLILHPSNERKAIVLDNVLFINSKEERLTKLLGAIKVEVRR